MTFSEITNELEKEGFEFDLIDQDQRQPAIVIDTKDLHMVLNLLHSDPRFYFDHLACLSGVDYGEDQPLGVVYHLYSIPLGQSIVVKVKVDRTQPKVPSVVSIWGGANWHEREVFDMYGIEFEGHPQMKRILMPADWEGHPLRKDYKEQESYRGMSVVYDRDETPEN